MSGEKNWPPRVAGVFLALLGGAGSRLALAAEEQSPSFGFALVKMLVALGVVLGLFALAVYFLKRAGFMPVGTQGGDLRVERVVSLGYRSRLAVVRAGGRRLLLGVTPSSIRRLGELDGDAPPDKGEDRQ